MPIRNCLDAIVGIPTKQNIVDKFDALVKGGMNENEAGMKVIEDFHKGLIDDLNQIKKELKIKPEPYKPLNKTKIQSISNEYETKIYNKKNELENATTKSAEQQQESNQQTSISEHTGVGASRDETTPNETDNSNSGGNGTGTRQQEEVGGGGSSVGVSHASLKDLAEKLGLPEPKRGERLTSEEFADRGRRLLKAGADVNKLEQDFKNGKQPTADDISVARAHLEDLVRQADDMKNTHGIDSQQFKDANKEVERFTTEVVKTMGTAASEPFTALQGKRDLDTDSFVMVKRNVEDLTGKPLTADQQKKVDELTTQNQELKKQAEESEAKLIQAKDEAFKKGVEEGKKQTKAEKGKKVADKLRDAAKLHKPGSFSAATPASVVWDAAVEIVAKSIEAGGKLADVIEEGLKYIRGTDWYKALSDDKKNKAEQDFKQFNNDNAGGSSLEDLQTRLADKKGNKFSIEEARDIWDYAKKTYLDKGIPYRDMISHVGDDLGLSWRQVNEAIASPKTKRVEDDMWVKQAKYRRGQNVTKTWVENQNKSAAGRALKKVSGLFRGVAVFGHGGIFIGTHAAPTLFQPSTWNKVIPAFFRGWKYAYGNHAAYEQAMEELKNRPTYALAQRAGLKNNPDRLNVEEFQNSQKYLGKLGEAGEKGFNAIKVLRQDLFDFHYNKLSAVDKADPEAIKRIAKLVNNATGASNLNIPEWVNEVSFAGGMEAARWGKLITNPAKAGATALKAIFTPNKVSAADKVFAKVWARRVGEQLATYTSLLLANAAIQNTLNPKNPVNLTNPNKPDWLKFKFGDLTLDPTSGMRSAATFIYSLAHDSFKSKKELKGDTVLEADAKNAGGYLRGKLSPLYSTLADLKTKVDFSGNPLPFNNEKPSAGKHQLTWGEYLAEKAPLPLAEAVSVMMKSAQDNGADKVQLHNIIDGIISGGISGTTGFRVGEYNAEEAKHSPFTEEDNKKPAFKYFLDKGLELPNVSLSNEPITDDQKGTKKMVSDYPKEKQDAYLKEHKRALHESLSDIISNKTVYVTKYKDAKGNPIDEVSINVPKGNYRETSINKLSKEELAQVLSIAQKQATKTAKEKIFP